ncbi:MAG: BrnT family toxin [Anaerolineae bacterium]|nr:BrnT family toxin [Anaerolineae bacterium]
MGLSNRNRLLLVAYTERNERIRIISARKATKHEEKFYDEAK